MPIVTSMGTVAVYLGYVIPVILGLRAGRPSGPWNLGAWSKPVAYIAIAYSVFISLVLVMPPNELAGSPLAEEIRATGAFRADVSGTEPALYGLFHQRRDADAAKRALRRLGRTWLAAPAWYG